MSGRWKPSFPLSRPGCLFNPMSVLVEKNLLAALGELNAAVKAMPAANPKPDLLPLFARIDELAKQLSPDTDEMLLHYLHKKSYEKAWLYLLGREAENQAGNCRHV